MKKHILTTIFLCTVLVLSAQNVKKGYKSLEKGEYLKAKEVFAKNLSENKDHVASNFGMAMVLADEKSTEFNIVDAWEYIVAIQGKTSELNQDEIEILGEYFLATEERKTSRPVKKKLDIAIEAVESRLIKYIREENDLDAVYAVLEKYPDYRFYDNVVHIRNQFEYRKYENTNTMAAYSEFIDKFPDAAQVPKARQNQHKMAFEEAKASNTVVNYNKYIKDYPDSKYLSQAMKMRNEAAFTEAKTKNTLEAYERFIWLYPDALQIPEARKQQRELMYEKAKRIKTLEAYNEFIRNYPEGSYYVDVFNLKANDLGAKYAKEIGVSIVDMLWAKGLDNNEHFEQAQALAGTSDGGFILAGTSRLNDTSYSDAWIVKLDNSGKMLWNKTIGQPFNDVVDKVFVTSTDDVIVLGYTQVSSDSGAYLGWMFKLGADGTKMWNKNLGNVEISAAAMSSDDHIFLSSYEKDTLTDKLFIKELDSEGHFEWARSYIRNGRFTGINISDNGNVLLSGGQWLVYTDPKFYIKWEDTLKVAGDYKFADINTSMVSVVSSDSTINKQFSYSLSGQKSGSADLALTANEKINEMLVLRNNKSLVFKETESGSELLVIDEKGSSSKTRSYAGASVVSAIENANGTISLLLDGDDYILITLKPTGI